MVKYRVHDNAMSDYDEENQVSLREDVINKFKKLEDNISFLTKIYYSTKLFFHYLRTWEEKKIKK